MGTSQSSAGPGAGVPLVPPWADAPDGSDPDTGAGVPDGEQPVDNEAEPARTPELVAPARRFRDSRRNLGSYAVSGDDRQMRRALGHYVRSGYGGSGTATQRFRGTARTAGGLFDVLTRAADAAGAAGPESPLDPSLLGGRSADEIINAVVEAVRPVDGTQDAEASRPAIRDALSEVLSRYPDADLLNLTDEQRAFVIERYVGLDIYNRFSLDVGKVVVERAPTPSTGLGRLKQVKDYIKEAVAATFRGLLAAGRRLTTGRVSGIVREVLTETFQVFEGYVE